MLNKSNNLLLLWLIAYLCYKQKLMQKSESSFPLLKRRKPLMWSPIQKHSLSSLNSSALFFF